tara:strand:- start:3876 stop:5564 length:1689 start_codon:yes stop_codon:yes gene_type:complete
MANPNWINIVDVYKIYEINGRDTAPQRMSFKEIKEKIPDILREERINEEAMSFFSDKKDTSKKYFKKMKEKMVNRIFKIGDTIEMEGVKYVVKRQNVSDDGDTDRYDKVEEEGYENTDDSEENKDKPKLKFQRFYRIPKKIIVLDPNFSPGKDKGDKGDEGEKDGEGEEKEKEKKIKELERKQEEQNKELNDNKKKVEQWLDTLNPARLTGNPGVKAVKKFLEKDSDNDSDITKFNTYFGFWVTLKQTKKETKHSVEEMIAARKNILKIKHETEMKELKKELEKKRDPIEGYGNKSLIPTFYKYVLDGYKLNNKLSNVLGQIKRNAQQIKGKDSRAINRSLNDRLQRMIERNFKKRESDKYFEVLKVSNSLIKTLGDINNQIKPPGDDKIKSTTDSDKQEIKNSLEKIIKLAEKYQTLIGDFGKMKRPIRIKKFLITITLKAPRIDPLTGKIIKEKIPDSRFGRTCSALPGWTEIFTGQSDMTNIWKNIFQTSGEALDGLFGIKKTAGGKRKTRRKKNIILRKSHRMKKKGERKRKSRKKTGTKKKSSKSAKKKRYSRKSKK